MSPIIILEIMPLVLAIAVIFYSAYTFTTERRLARRIARVLSIISAIILLVAQLGWYFAYVVNGDLLQTEAANTLWSIFNNIVMVIALLHVLPRSRTSKS